VVVGRLAGVAGLVLVGRRAEAEGLVVVGRLAGVAGLVVVGRRAEAEGLVVVGRLAGVAGLVVVGRRARMVGHLLEHGFLEVTLVLHFRHLVGEVDHVVLGHEEVGRLDLKGAHAYHQAVNHVRRPVGEAFAVVGVPLVEEGRVGLPSMVLGRVGRPLVVLDRPDLEVDLLGLPLMVLDHEEADRLDLAADHVGR
jgi:hypothetical protein